MQCHLKTFASNLVFCSCIVNNFDKNLYCKYVLQCYYGVTIIILCMFVYKID